MNPYTRYSAGNWHPNRSNHQHEWNKELVRIRGACSSMTSDLRQYQKVDPQKIQVNVIGKWNRISEEAERVYRSRSPSPTKGQRSAAAGPRSRSSSPVKGQAQGGEVGIPNGDKATKHLEASQQRLNLVFANIVQNLNNIMAGVENGDDADPVKRQNIRQRIEAIQAKFRGIAEHMVRMNGESSMTDALQDSLGRAEAWMQKNAEEGRQEEGAKSRPPTASEGSKKSSKKKLDGSGAKTSSSSTANAKNSKKAAKGGREGSEKEDKKKTGDKKRSKSAAGVTKGGKSFQKFADSASEGVDNIKEGSKLERMLRQQAAVIQQQAAVIQEQALLLTNKKGAKKAAKAASGDKQGTTLLEVGSEDARQGKTVDSGKDADVSEALATTTSASVKKKKSVPQKKAAAKKGASVSPIAGPPPTTPDASPSTVAKSKASGKSKGKGKSRSTAAAKDPSPTSTSAEDKSLERSEIIRRAQQTSDEHFVSGELQSGPISSEQEMARRRALDEVATDVSAHVVEMNIASDSDIHIKSMSSNMTDEHQKSEKRHPSEIKQPVGHQSRIQEVVHPLEEGEKLDVKPNKEADAETITKSPKRRKDSSSESEESETEQLIEQFLVNQGLVEGFTHKGDLIEEKFLQKSVAPKKKNSFTETLLTQYVDDLEDMLHMLVSRVAKQNEDEKEKQAEENQKKLAGYSWNDLLMTENLSQFSVDELQTILKNQNGLNSDRTEDEPATISQKLQKIQVKMDKIEDEFLDSMKEGDDCVEDPQDEDDEDLVQNEVHLLSFLDIASRILHSLTTIIDVIGEDEDDMQHKREGGLSLLSLPVQNPTVEIKWNKGVFDDAETLEAALMKYLTDPFLAAYGLSSIPRQHFTRVRPDEGTATEVYGDDGYDLVGLIQIEWEKRRKKIRSYCETLNIAKARQKARKAAKAAEEAKAKEQMNPAFNRKSTGENKDAAAGADNIGDANGGEGFERIEHVTYENLNAGGEDTGKESAEIDGSLQEGDLNEIVELEGNAAEGTAAAGANAATFEGSHTAIAEENNATENGDADAVHTHVEDVDVELVDEEYLKEVYSSYGLEGNPFQSEPHLTHCIRNVILPVLFEAVYVQKYSEQGDANGSPPNSPLRKMKRQMRMPLRLDVEPLTLEYEINSSGYQTSRDHQQLSQQETSQQHLISQEETAVETAFDGTAVETAVDANTGASVQGNHEWQNVEPRSLDNTQNVEGTHEMADEARDGVEVAPVHEESDGAGAEPTAVQDETKTEGDAPKVKNKRKPTRDAGQDPPSKANTACSVKTKTLSYLPQIDLDCDNVTAYRKLHAHHDRQLLMRVDAGKNLWLTPDELNRDGVPHFLQNMLLLPKSPPDYVKVYSCGYRGNNITDLAEMVTEIGIPQARRRSILNANAEGPAEGVGASAILNKASTKGSVTELISTKAAVRCLESDDGEIMNLLAHGDDALFEISAPDGNSLTTITYQLMKKLNPSAPEVKSGEEEEMPNLFD